MSISDEQQNPGDSSLSEPAQPASRLSRDSGGPTQPLEGQSRGPLGVPLPIQLFATGLYTGYAPFAPGSAASLLGILIYFAPGFDHPLVILAAIGGCFFLGVHASSRMEQIYGRDPRVVVIDEIVGMWISLALLPKHPGVVALAFFIFRLVDILKPYPVRQSERLRGGWGVMVDDVIAGIYTNLLMRIFLYVYQL